MVVIAHTTKVAECAFNRAKLAGNHGVPVRIRERNEPKTGCVESSCAADYVSTTFERRMKTHPLTDCVSSFILLRMGTLSFVRRHSTLIAFTVALGSSAVFVACGSDSNNGSPDSGTGGTSPESGAGGSSGGKGGSGGTAGKGGTAGSAGKGGGGAGGGTGGKGGSAGMITSNGDAALDGTVPDGH